MRYNKEIRKVLASIQFERVPYYHYCSEGPQFHNISFNCFKGYPNPQSRDNKQSIQSKLNQTNKTPAAPAITPTTPIFFTLTPAPVLCTTGRPVRLALAVALVLTVTPKLGSLLTALWIGRMEDTPVVDALATEDDDGRRFSLEVVAPLSTENGRPQDEVVDWDVERPMRERRVVFPREDLRILKTLSNEGRNTRVFLPRNVSRREEISLDGCIGPK
jgi:hypothetical protein